MAREIEDIAAYAAASSGDELIISLSGDWRHHKIQTVQADFPDLANNMQAAKIKLDMSAVTHFDTAGAWLIHKFKHNCAEVSKKYEFVGADATILSLIDEVSETLSEPDPEIEPQPSKFSLDRVVNRTANGLRAIYADTNLGLHILGATIRGSQLKKGSKSVASPAAIINQVDQIGVRAVPIIILISLAIGAIISQQAAFQLKVFGADVFAVDLVSVLQLREVGVIITSIMIAGRSGSAITAEIGSMKMREEVDALTVMGLNPIGVLVFPRIIAMMIALPLLTIVANFAALFASAVVLYFYSEVPFNVFLVRMKAFIDFTTISSGMIKTPFMAIMIGIVAAVEGLKVGGSAESLGRRVTAAVVKSIFLVIIIDGIFAIFYAAIDF